jgi:hypothetical protein
MYGPYNPSRGDESSLVYDRKKYDMFNESKG